MDAPPCTIRPARPIDVPAIQAMKQRLALAEGALHAINASEADWQRDLFGQAPRFAVFIAELAGTAIGMIILSERFFPGWTWPVLHVNDLFVVPERRCLGAGRALLARAAQEAISRQATCVGLDVRKDSQARRLYRKAGFTRVHNYAAYVLAGSALSRLADLGEAVAGLIG
jgi:ribosomal protein S18 acetylase RimI-like enzyme